MTHTDFKAFGLADTLLSALARLDITQPTPIQAQAIPAVMKGRDVLGIAQTGTGKTAAFSLPVIDALIAKGGRPAPKTPKVLVLTPTRELASQIAGNVKSYTAGTKLTHHVIFGGVSIRPQIEAMRRGVDIVIATPGRLLDLLNQRALTLSEVHHVVLDEADRMLDMGFIPDIEEICTKLPKQRQTLLFSATMPAPIKKLADKFLDNPKMIEVARPASTNTNIKEYVVPVSGNAFKKRDRLRQLLAQEEVASAIIFCNRKTTVRELNKSLRKHGYKSGEIHGDMDQSSRIAELDLFKDGIVNILVASDVAARGLDVKGVSHVFNFDAPWHPDDYVHRIGRTGRAGATGVAYTLVTSEDAENIANIEKLTGHKIERLGDSPIENEDEREEAPAPRARRGRGGASTTEPRERTRPPRAAAPAEETAAPERAARAPRTREATREDTTARTETPRIEQVRAEPARRPPRTNERRDRDEDTADTNGWNGPLPAFLNATIGV